MGPLRLGAVSASGTALRDWLPDGRGLPDDIWAARHRWVVRILATQCLAIVILAFATGTSLEHSLPEVVVPALLIVLALESRVSKTLRSVSGATGLMLISAALVHLSSGHIEAHFHFLLMILIVALYEAWVPFAVAVGVVLIHHGVEGSMNPAMLYNHPAAIAHPWLWAGIHVGAISLACAGAVVNWKAQERMRESEAKPAAQVLHLANHDSLTGLPSRAIFPELLRQAPVTEERTGTSTSVLGWADEGCAAAILPGPTETAALRAALHACRSLLSIEGPEDAAEIAERLVADLGGQVVDADTGGSQPVPVDVSFGHGSPRLPFAPVGSPMRALLETYVPGFVRDAHRALELVDRSARLAEDASIDPLTGVHNRRAIGRILGRLRDGDTVVILDLDHFKSINDTLGHLVGDEVLRAFGAALRVTARATDRVGRYGGEEFVVVLANTEPELFLGRLRQEWESLRPHPVTFSGGYTGPGVPPMQALNAADRALYRAKDLGRDRWERTIKDDLL